jgi:hypothetical protein
LSEWKRAIKYINKLSGKDYELNQQPNLHELTSNVELLMTQLRSFGYKRPETIGMASLAKSVLKLNK